MSVIITEILNYLFCEYIFLAMIFIYGNFLYTSNINSLYDYYVSNFIPNVSENSSKLPFTENEWNPHSKK